MRTAVYAVGVGDAGLNLHHLRDLGHALALCGQLRKLGVHRQAHAVQPALRQVTEIDGVLVMPSMPDIALLRSADEASLEAYCNHAVQMLCMAGLSGFPQISLPLASRNSAPLGISLLGPRGSDKSLIGLAEKLAVA